MAILNACHIPKRTARTTFAVSGGGVHLALAVCTLLWAVSAFAQAETNLGETLSAQNQSEAEKTQDKAPSAKSDDAQTQRPTLSADGTGVPGKPTISPNEHTRLTFGDRWTLYHRSIFTPEILAGPAFGAGLGQLRNDPGEWHEGIAGYGHRFGSGLARSVIARTISFGVAAGDGEDPRFLRSEESGFWPRTRHAIVWTFVTRNQNGTRMPAFSRFAGAYGAAFAANRWYPSSENNTNHALKMGSTAIASSVGFHVLSEFWPDILRAVHLKAK